MSISRGPQASRLFFVFSILFLIPITSIGQGEYVDQFSDPNQQIVPGYVIVKFKEGIDPSSTAVMQLLEGIGMLSIERTFPTAEKPSEKKVTPARINKLRAEITTENNYIHAKQNELAAIKKGCAAANLELDI